jgi:flagellar biosynthesis/type III secretory pathway protein FliH
MPVIRNEQARNMAPRAIALELDDVRGEAESILAAARTHAAELQARARADAEALRAQVIEEARAEGERAGHAAGLERGRAEGMERIIREVLEPNRELFEQLGPVWVEQLTRFGVEREQLLDDARRELLGLAIEIARRVIHRTVEVDETICLDQVSEAIELLGRPAEMRISVCSADLEILEHALPGLLEKARMTDGIELIESNDVQRGGCLVSTGEGSVDAGIETQLARIAEALVPGGER